MSLCPQCGNQASYVQQYGRWYCSSCQNYLPVTPPPPAQPQQYQQPAAQQQYQQPAQPQTYQQPGAQQPYQQPAYGPQTTPPPTSQKGGNKTKIIVVAVIAVVAIIIIAAIFLLLLKSDEDKLIGKWSASEEGVEQIWTFKSGGSGTVEVNGYEFSFTWSIDEANKELSMTLYGSTDVLKYRFIDDNTLELTAKGEDPVRLTRV